MKSNRARSWTHRTEDLCVTLRQRTLENEGEKYFIGHANAEMQAVEGNVIRSSKRTLFFFWLVWLDSTGEELKIPLGLDTFTEDKHHK